MSILSQIKARCGIPEKVTVYDEPELQPLIDDALEDMRTAGVPEWILRDKGEETNPRVLTAVTLYVQGMRGADRTDTDKYLHQYRRKLHKLMLEPEEEENHVDDVDSTADEG